MTAYDQLIIPGLDHSLRKVGDLFVWKTTPGAQPTQERKHVKRSKAKADPRRNNGPNPGQKVIWEDMA